MLPQHLDGANPRHQLTKEETTKLLKLETIMEKLQRGSNVQNRQPQTWLSDDEYAQMEQAILNQQTSHPIRPQAPLPNQQDSR